MSEYDPYVHVRQLTQSMQAVRVRAAASMPQPTHAPAFIEHADGSVTSRDGTQVRPPRAESKGA